MGEWGKFQRQKKVWLSLQSSFFLHVISMKSPIELYSKYLGQTQRERYCYTTV
jgi:hypothetical protein